MARGTLLRPATGLAVLLGLLACSSSSSSAPANVSGNYTIAITNRDNGCMLANWTAGQSTSGITMQITQNGTAVTGDLTGLTGAYVALVLGSATFQGSVNGATITMTDYGSRKFTMGACMYTLNATATGSLSGDTLTGTVTYTAVTNHASDCGNLESCVSTQDFNGTRPPS